MTPTIHTLIKDIYKVVGSNEGWFNGSIAEEFSRELNARLVENTGPKHSVSALRLSKMGEHCPCQLWHSVHTPELAERPQPHALIKFTYGHILETLVIALAKAAGHEVTGEQDELILDGVKGHRDCVVDGVTVDVKSVNSLGFQKVKAGLVATDPFLRDYLDQLDGYTVAAYEDPLVRVKDKAYIIFIDKVLGKLALYEHTIREDHIRSRVRAYKELVSRPSAPACTCGTVSDGSSGNIKLDTKASYNPFKYSCHPNLRTFLYSEGPRYLTKVVRRPMNKGIPIIEVDRNGQIVYN
jgi:hypothetical protein